MKPKRHRAPAWVIVILMVLGACARGGTGEGRAACPVPGAGERIAEREPVVDTAAGSEWTLLPPAPIPPRRDHVAVWTEQQMIVWGGKGADGWLSDGATFDPRTRRWTRIADAPVGDFDRAAGVWTGREVLVAAAARARPGPCGRKARFETMAYSPADDAWRELPPAPVQPYAAHRMLWTGEEALLWGAATADPRSFMGAAYSPDSNRWRPLRAWDAVLPLGLLLGDGEDEDAGAWDALWIGDEMLVWGTAPGSFFGRGARYDPRADAWRRLAPSPLPGRFGHSLVWTGDEMLVWGGHAAWGIDNFPNDGAAYAAATRDWDVIKRPTLRGIIEHDAVWTGSDMLVYAARPNERAVEEEQSSVLMAYDRGADSWEPLPTPPLEGTSGFSLVWTGRALIIWGGIRGAVASGGALYDPGA